MIPLSRRGALGAAVAHMLSSTRLAAAQPSVSTSVPPGVKMPSRPETITRRSFPLRADATKRYLLDSDDRPFLLNGDTAWSLIAQLTLEGADKYLADRQARGFNAILVNLIEHKFSAHPPRNAYGHTPFHEPGNFSTPNDAYFDHALRVVLAAERRGLLVLMTPAYLGFRGGDQGWYQEMVASPLANLGHYGRYLGRRFRSAPNVLWVNGGDFDPPAREVTREVAQGIRELDPDSLMTAHGAEGTPAAARWGSEAWLDIDTVYTYEPVFEPCLRRRDAALGRRPFMLIESRYEGEADGTEQRIRAQAYGALLAGAAGHVFGNNPLWTFGAEGVFPAAMRWEQALASPGGRSMTHLRSLFERLPWWLLEPDRAGRLVRGDLGVGHRRIAAALTSDRSVAVLYLPVARNIAIDTTQLSEGELRLSVIDPSTGRAAIDAEPVARTKRYLWPRLPGRNASGYADWVIVIGSQPGLSGLPEGAA